MCQTFKENLNVMLKLRTKTSHISINNSYFSLKSNGNRSPDREPQSRVTHLLRKTSCWDPWYSRARCSQSTLRGVGLRHMSAELVARPRDLLPPRRE